MGERNPTAAMALGVPGTLIALAAVAAYPFVFVPALILLSVALLASARYLETHSSSK
ncbi:hypothetical protein IHV82_05315 [Mycobacterium avium]|uniref:hypothetical protein n=1 Tax=Mycobacterium avium TaxID=1764 RepID=UPI000319082C|nr:hypothetical protein [Mycobacterium avium]WOF20077.1 hypothetical protein IHV82_05315 [Mycobacterium avium]